MAGPASNRLLRRTQPASSAGAPGAVSMALLHGFELRLDGAAVELPLSAQRVVAFLALHERPLQRLFVSGCLWLESPQERANASLRTALWRLAVTGSRLVHATSNHLALADGVLVDVREATASARRALRHESESHDFEDLRNAGELLPDWYDDWVLIERERFRQLRLHALESLCDELAEQGRFADAVEAGIAAVAGEPLRESAHRALIRAYVAEGNASEALRQHRIFTRLLRDQLDAEPSSLMKELMRALPNR
jgi:DNA-binding SARP family transcriptional activator